MLHTSRYEILDCLDTAWLWIRPTSIFAGASSLSMFHSGLCEPSACMWAVANILVPGSDVDSVFPSRRLMW